MLVFFDQIAEGVVEVLVMAVAVAGFRQPAAGVVYIAFGVAVAGVAVFIGMADAAVFDTAGGIVFEYAEDTGFVYAP